MGLLVEGAVAISADVEPFDLGRDVEEALGAEEEASARSGVPDEPERGVKRRFRGARRELEIDRPALDVEAEGDRDRLQDRGLAASVLDDEVGDGRKSEIVERLYRRKIERIRVGILDLLGHEPHAVEERRAHRMTMTPAGAGLVKSAAITSLRRSIVARWFV